MPKEIFDRIPLISLSKKNAVLDQNLSSIIKTSKSCDLNVANCPSKKITQTLELFQAAEENYGDEKY